MSLARAIRSTIMRRFADPARRAARWQRAEQARQRAGRAHEVLYFHQIDDPYSQLAVQALAPFLARYAVELKIKVVAEPTPIAIHEQSLWDQWAARDAAAIAPYYGLEYEAPVAKPDAEQLALARRLALMADTPQAFAAHARRIDRVLQSGATDALAQLAAGQALPSAAEAQQRLDENFKLRHKLGHYLGGMFHYEGEWYWGIDRLHYLEARLDALGTRRADAPTGPSVALRRSAQRTVEGSQRLRLEFFPSLRSPYTHLSYARVAELCRRYPVDLVLRPVLPMMMRGVKADRRKGLYIVQDTLREAESLGIPFGNIWDPFGTPVLRAYSLFPWARDRGRGFEYLHAYSQAVWSERVNAYSLPGLRSIVERAGLPWSEAQARLDNRDWEAELERNVQDMVAAGSWGVPTLRLAASAHAAEFTVWGQDRIWLIEEEILKRLRR